MKLTLTVDVEEFYHLLETSDTIRTAASQSRHSSIETVLPDLLELLDDHKTKAIFFWLGSMASRHRDLLREVVRRGHEIGSHSHSHHCHHELTDKEFECDLKRSIEALTSVTGQKVLSYRAPGFSLTENFFHRYDVLAEHGIKYDYSLFAGRASHGGVVSCGSSIEVRFATPHGLIRSFPFHLQEFAFNRRLGIFGGGYLRLAPKALLAKYVSSDKRQIVYIHPRDLDVGQPRMSGLPLKRVLKSYIGISGMKEKVEYMLDTFDWLAPAEYRGPEGSEE